MVRGGKGRGEGLRLEQIDFSHGLGCLVFKSGALRGVILLRIFAGAVFEVEVAQVVVEVVAALAQVFEARLVALRFGVGIGQKT